MQKFQHISGYDIQMVQWFGVIISWLSCQSVYSRAEPFGVPFPCEVGPDCLMTVFLAPFSVSSSLCLWLVVGWMDGQFSTSLF